MGKHGARQQKKLAKQKAKRLAKRTKLSRFSSNDPTVRLQRVQWLPIVKSLVAETLWEDGIGYLVIAREEPDGHYLYAVYLVDVYCLGVKNAFWRASTPGEFRDAMDHIEANVPLRPIEPACLAKIVKGAVEYAQLFDFVPHRDYRHASLLLEGIDPSACPHEYSFGRDGRPLYINGPFESPAEVQAIMERIQQVGGHFTIGGPASALESLGIEYDADDDDDADDE